MLKKPSKFHCRLLHCAAPSYQQHSILSHNPDIHHRLLDLLRYPNHPPSYSITQHIPAGPLQPRALVATERLYSSNLPCMHVHLLLPAHKL